MLWIIGNLKVEPLNIGVLVMSDWIGLAVIGFLVLCGVAGLWQLSKPYDVSVEEFEKRAHEAPSLMSAGLTGLQKILDPAAKNAEIAQENFKQGRFDDKQAKGEGDEAGGGRQEAVGRTQEQEQEETGEERT